MNKLVKYWEMFTFPRTLLVVVIIPLSESILDKSYCSPNDTLHRDESKNPYSPLVNCSNLPIDFIICDEPLDLGGNETKKAELGYGCIKFGGERWEDVEHTAVMCCALSGIECYGNTTFFRTGFPCIKYRGHYFISTLMYSVLLGFLGLDRFCLGHTGTGVGKLLTLGGAGLWWLVDICLLLTGTLTPEDGSNWMPYY